MSSLYNSSIRVSGGDEISALACKGGNFPNAAAVKMTAQAAAFRGESWGDGVGLLEPAAASMVKFFLRVLCEKRRWVTGRM